MKKFFIFLILGFFSSFSLAKDMNGVGLSFVFVNSTQYPMYIRTLWNTSRGQTYVKEKVEASECIYIYPGYCKNEPSFSSQNCTRGWFMNPPFMMDIEGEELRSYGIHGEVIEKTSYWFNRFEIKDLQKEIQLREIHGSCREFNPRQAIFIGGDGNTLLHEAVLNNDLEEVERHIAGGASVNIRNKDGYTPLDLAKNQQTISHRFKNDLSEHNTEFDDMINLLMRVKAKSSSDLIWLETDL